MTPEHRQAICALMVRFADGEREAFRPLFEALWPVLLAITTRALPERADAEDAAQRAMLVLFDKIVLLDRDRDGVAWAATIAAYEVMTIRRRAQRRRDTTDVNLHDRLAGVVDPGADPEAQLAQAELRAAVRAAIGELPARDREALAELLADRDVDQGETPRKRRTRALARLRAVWRRSHG